MSVEAEARRAADALHPAARRPATLDRPRWTTPIVGDRHPVRRGLGLRHLRRLRRGVPGAHRARGQDRGLRRNLVLEEARFPAELTRRMHGDGAPRQPLGPAREPAARLDPGPAVRGADRGGGRRGRTRTRSRELECLYWVGCAAAFDERNKRVARAFVTCLDAAGVQLRRARPGGELHRRPGAPDGQRVRLPDARARATSRRSTAIGRRRSSPPARTASTRSATSTASSAATTRSSTTRRTWPAWWRRGGCDRRAADPASRHATHHLPRRLLPGALQRRRSRSRGRSWAPCPGVEHASRWSGPGGRRSAVARAAAGCGWRRTAGRASTPSGRARRWTPAPSTVATACPFCLVMLRDGLSESGARGEGVQTQDVAELLASALVSPVLPAQEPAGPPVGRGRGHLAGDRGHLATASPRALAASAALAAGIRAGSLAAERPIRRVSSTCTGARVRVLPTARMKRGS